jgi:V8-like Glu-specific endopeptidase
MRHYSEVVEVPIRRPRSVVPRLLLVPPPSSPTRPETGPVADLSKSPFRSVGLLVDAHTGTATTAWLTRPDIIVTAGHCLEHPDQPGPRSFHFALQYSRLYGGYWSRVVQAATLKGWAQYRDYRYDLALCRLDRSFGVKGIGISPWLEKPPRHCLVLGYAFGGAQLWQSHCSDLRWSSRGGRVSAAMTEGCSGGPWLVKTGRLYVPVGITSRGGEGLLLSPAWAQGIENLLEWSRSL